MQQVINRIRLVAVYAALLLPVIVYGAVHALQSSNNSPIDWVDSSFAERQHYDRFVELFGPGDCVVASWPTCDWSDKRLDVLVRGLRSAKAFRGEDGSPLFHNVTSGREILLAMSGLTGTAFASPGDEAEVTGPSESTAGDSATAQEKIAGIPNLADRAVPKLQVTEAIQRLQGTMIGNDGHTTCIVVTFNSAGLARRTELVDRLRRAIRVCCEVRDEDIHLAGPVIDGMCVDEASHTSLTKLAGPSAVVVFLICWWSLGSILSGVLVFLTASFCQAALLAIIYFSGEKLSALLIILPPLVQVLTVSGGVHLMNYYLNASQTMPPQQAAIDAFRKGWRPSLLSLGTTAMGTASLVVSGLEPIRLFGVYGTIGVLLTSATVLTVIPCTMMFLGRNRTAKTTAADAVQVAALPAESSRSDGVHSDGILWLRLASLLHNHNAFVLTCIIGGMSVASVGLPKLQTSIRIETLFGSDSRIIQDYQWLEANIGPLVPIEILVTFDDSCRLSDRVRLNTVWQLNRILRKHGDIQSTTSALTVFPTIPPQNSLPGAVRLGILNKAIMSARPAFEQMAFLRHSKEGEVWRVTAHVNSMMQIDYGLMLNEIRTQIESELQIPGEHRGQITVTTSGIMPLVHQIQGQLLSDLFYSLLTALLVITVTMTVVEAGVMTGVLAMMSNIFPIVTAFGVMGLLQHPMDIGSVMTASVALGIAVDDTLHFLAFFRRSAAHPGATRFSAVLSAYQHCGPAMIQTSLSCGLGLLVFALSDFVPTSRFAILMATLLLLALLGDLLLLPAILLSRAGNLFMPNAN